jgi:selenide,water dikinase
MTDACLAGPGRGVRRAALRAHRDPRRAGRDLAEVHALTDVTGFGLLGHLNEIALGSGLAARVRLRDIPWLPRVRELAAAGFVTGASGRNWAGYGKHVTLRNVDDTARALLTDPQTSGGLLVACAPDAVGGVLELFRAEGFHQAAVVGELATGSGVTVEG